MSQTAVDDTDLNTREFGVLRRMGRRVSEKPMPARSCKNHSSRRAAGFAEKSKSSLRPPAAACVRPSANSAALRENSFHERP